jgi:carbamoylphosphate synthase large subunit
LTLAVEREKPDAIPIGSDVELPVVAAHRAQPDRDFDVQVVVSSPEMVGSPTISTAPTSSWSSIGSTPLTCLAGEEDALLAKVGYPVVVKPRQGARSVGMLVAGDRSALDRAIAEAASPVVIQEYLLDERTEYAAGALVFDGRCDASIVMRRELGDGYTGRSSTRIPSSIGWSARWPTGVIFAARGRVTSGSTDIAPVLDACCCTARMSPAGYPICGPSAPIPASIWGTGRSASSVGRA